MRENEKSILPNEAEAAFGVENAAEPERAERRITAENLWEIIRFPARHYVLHGEKSAFYLYGEGRRAVHRPPRPFGDEEHF